MTNWEDKRRLATYSSTLGWRYAGEPMSLAELSVLCCLGSNSDPLFQLKPETKKRITTYNTSPSRRLLFADATKCNNLQSNYCNCLLLHTLATIVHRSRFGNDGQHHARRTEPPYKGEGAVLWLYIGVKNPKTAVLELFLTFYFNFWSNLNPLTRCLFFVFLFTVCVTT